MVPTLIEPDTSPRDPTDWLVAGVVMVLQQILLMGTPAMIAWSLTESVVLCVLAASAVLLFFGAHTVTHLEVSAKGIRFARLLGTPGWVEWDELTLIRPAGRAEVIWLGWLWPIYPPREASPSYSSQGHYRFEGPEGYAYFPPKDRAQFEAAIRKNAPDHVVLESTIPSA
ncbi:MAG: hypothetical protein KC912_23135 [Proteobacteria bacterium]|nr:hypothetical protein [Pseudomonadota bacterium]